MSWINLNDNGIAQHLGADLLPGRGHDREAVRAHQRSGLVLHSCQALVHPAGQRTVLYVLCAASLILFMNMAPPQTTGLWLVVGLYILNGLLNAVWTYIFFERHLLGWAFVDALAIAATALMMLLVVGPYSQAASWCLLPYFLWACFATLLSYRIVLLNRD